MYRFFSPFLFLFSLICGSSLPGQTQIRINLFDSENANNEEYIEIINAGPSDVDLSGWSISVIEDNITSSTNREWRLGFDNNPMANVLGPSETFGFAGSIRTVNFTRPALVYVTDGDGNLYDLLETRTGGNSFPSSELPNVPGGYPFVNPVIWDGSSPAVQRGANLVDRFDGNLYSSVAATSFSSSTGFDTTIFDMNPAIADINDTAPVPEPAFYAVAMAGLSAIVLLIRRRRR